MASNDFDFKAFNALCSYKPAGLQIYLAQQLLSNALSTMVRYDNPRAEDVLGLVSEIKALRALLKQDAVDRERGNDRKEPMEA